MVRDTKKSPSRPEIEGDPETTREQPEIAPPRAPREEVVERPGKEPREIEERPHEDRPDVEERPQPGPDRSDDHDADPERSSDVERGAG